MLTQIDLFAPADMDEPQRPDYSDRCPTRRPCHLTACRYHTGNADPALSCALDASRLGGLTVETVATIMELPLDTVADLERSGINKLRRKRVLVVLRNG